MGTTTRASARARSPADLTVTTKTSACRRRRLARAGCPHERPFLRGLSFVDGTQATWLVPEGHRSCGTAPDSHRLRCGTSAGVYVPGCARIPPKVTSAAILTIGNEVVSGDVTNTNATWLAQRLETLGVRVLVAAAVPDEEGAIGDFVRRERVRVDHLIVTGGLGGTPDDITREALAAAFGVKQKEV